MSAVFDTTSPEGPSGGRRGLWIGLVVVVVSALVGLGIARLVVGNDGGKNDGGKPAESGSTTSGPARSGSPRVEQPGDHDHLAAPRLSQGPVKPIDRTRTTGKAGVRQGFAAGRDGAVSAAAHFITALYSPAMFDRRQRGPILDQLGGTALPANDRAELDGEYSGAAARLGVPDDGTVPAGKFLAAAAYVGHGAYRVIQADNAAATVEIWYFAEQAVVTGNTAPGGFWRRTTVVLKWTGDWKLAARPKHEAGPTPTEASGFQPPSDVERAELLRSHGSGWLLFTPAGA